MAAGISIRFRLGQGRREEFVKLAGAQKALVERLGGRLVVRSVAFGGPEALGTVSVTTLYRDAAERAKALEMIEHEERVPLREMRDSLDPPARAEARVLLNEIDPNGMPTFTHLLMVGAFTVAPGQSAAAREALLEGKAWRAKLGLESHVWRVVSGGPNAPTLTLTTNLSSYAEQARLSDEVEKAEMSGGTSVRKAIDAGVLTSMGITTSTLIEV